MYKFYDWAMTHFVLTSLNIDQVYLQLISVNDYLFSFAFLIKMSHPFAMIY